MYGVPIILGYDNAYPKPQVQMPVAYKGTWLERNFVAVGAWFIVAMFGAFSLAPVFV